MSKDSICLSNDAQPLVWPIDGERYENLYEEEYFVNGDPINSTITPLNRITNTLDTRGLPAPLNTARTVNGFASSTSIGFAGPSPSFQRTNAFDLSCRTKLANLDEKLTLIEKQIDYLDAKISKNNSTNGN